MQLNSKLGLSAAHRQYAQRNLPSLNPSGRWLNLKLEISRARRSAASDSVEGSRCGLDAGRVGFPRWWQRDIIVRGFCCRIASVLKLKYVQINGRSFLRLGG